MNPPCPQRHRWLGLMLSLFVPGFGLIRAGHIRRGLCWLVGMQLGALVFGICAAWSVVPMVIVALIFITILAVQVGMLCDSYRSGRMTVPLWLLFLGLLVALYFLDSPASLVVRPFKMPASSMEPTLLGSKAGSSPDHVMVDLLSYRLGAPQRGDLIVFATSQISGIRKDQSNEGEVFFTKRLVGLPGERIRIAGGKIYANGRLLDERDGIPPFNYIEPSRDSSDARMEGQDYRVGEGEYFVLGDNPPNSFDSRYWGNVPANSILGKVTLIYYPFKRAGRL